MFCKSNGSMLLILLASMQIFGSGGWGFESLMARHRKRKGNWVGT
jgi:hypothetical protein